MTEHLPIGDEAAAARRHQAHRYTELVERALPEQAGAYPRRLLARVRENPLSVAAWWALYNALSAAALRDQDHATGLWNGAAIWAKEGADMAGILSAIEQAAAPICATHGPMADSTDPAVQESHDGHRWHCAGAPRCRAAYWWIDGTYLTRNARVES